jgi:hypothetical protein
MCIDSLSIGGCTGSKWSIWHLENREPEVKAEVAPAEEKWMNDNYS